MPYTQLHLCVDGDGPVKTFNFLEHAVGQKCLAKLLGVGGNRLRRGFRLQPDIRYGKSKAGNRRQTYSVDSFLSKMYDTVAETLPDRWGHVRVQSVYK